MIDVKKEYDYQLIWQGEEIGLLRGENTVLRSENQRLLTDTEQKVKMLEKKVKWWDEHRWKQKQEWAKTQEDMAR